ncbi:MAG: extracellular solute-binding protein [Verrucomicrobiota bacterium]|nr:extracellular solute-binding protein [Verrucomicrobiota bacterium]
MLTRSQLIGLFVSLACVVLVGWWMAWPRSGLVVYCAHDAVYAEVILKKFTEKTGIKTRVKFDAESTKSLGLVELIEREARHPRCDVFWNNEVLGTMNLQEKNLLQPYKGAGYQRIPNSFKDEAGHWTGFAARLRVIIFYTPNKEKAGEIDRFSIANPLYGTTLTHFSILWQLWGADKTKEWYHDLQEKGAQVQQGNAMVKNAVASGASDWGFTDSDDYFVAVDEKKQVSYAPARVPGGRVIVIPNTVAIIKGTKREEQARQLMDYLLSEEVEMELAQSASRQIPLGPVDTKKLRPEVAALQALVSNAYSLDQRLLKPRAEAIQWLKSGASQKPKK